MPEIETAATKSFDEIAPVIKKYARACCEGCPDREAMALVLAWYYWEHGGRKDLPPTVWARVGVRHAITGRDIPGLRSRFRDAMKYRETQGAGMEGLADRRPGPVRTVIAREEFEIFWEGLDSFEREMADLLGEGLPNQEVARRMRRTPGAISQRRRRLMERHADQ